MFRPGTWWIIQNDSTLIKDTITMDSIVNYIDDGCREEIEANLEVLNCFGKLRNKPANILFYPLTREVFPLIEDSVLKSRIWASVSFQGSYSPLDTLDSMTINGHIFREVLVFDFQGIYQSYIAKNVYWIKSFDARDSTSYSLVDFHIVQ